MEGLTTIVNEAMIELHAWVVAGFEQRGKNATGKTLASVTESTVTTSTYVEGTMFADSQWRYVGNGRGPGGMPPVENIQAWIDAKGLDISAWAVAKTIAEFGSKDFRQKNSNIFTDAIDAWERLDLPVFEDRAGKELEDLVVEVARKNFKEANVNG